jgi:hypothetical protein
MKDKITEAVLALKGIYPTKMLDKYGKPDRNPVLLEAIVDNDYQDVFAGDYVDGAVGYDTAFADYICTQSEFLKRAKELGFIEQTGYRYGVEYETNGGKPEIPDDVKVELLCKAFKKYGYALKMCDTSDWGDTSSEYHPIKFRIVDERYKPTEATPEVMPVSAKPITDFDDCSIEFETPELDHLDVADALLEQIAVLMKLGEDELVGVLQGVNAKLIAKGEGLKMPKECSSNDWWDYAAGKPAYEGALPPVGVDVEFAIDGVFTGRKCKVIAFHKNTAWLHLDRNEADNLYSLERYMFRPLDHTTRAKELEKKRVVSEALDALQADYLHSNLDIVESLYDKGFLKMPEGEL